MCSVSVVFYETSILPYPISNYRQLAPDHLIVTGFSFHNQNETILVLYLNYQIKFEWNDLIFIISHLNYMLN